MSTVIVIRVSEYPAQRGPSLAWSLTYMRSWTAIIKMSEMVFSLIAFICSVAAPFCYSGCGWVNFATICCFIDCSVWFLMHLINMLIPNVFRHHLIESIFTAIFAVFLFIAGIVVAVAAGNWPAQGSLGASAFFCFFTMLLLGFDVYLTFVYLRALKGTQPPQADSAANTGPDGVEGGRHVRPSAPMAV